MIDTGKIDRIEHIYQEEQRLEEERRNVVADSEYDVSRLKVVYAITRAKGSQKGYERGEIREYFLFVALYVFDPTSIVRKMRRGLRSDLAAMLGIRENNVSKITKHILFRYRLYKQFRNEVNEIYDEVIEALKKI